ncbi:MAG: hypothetical protein ABIQ39_01600 [Ilumatobacteraceae bacterium]
MSVLQLEVPVDEPTLMIVPWHDPVVDSIGHDVRSMYVELFWLTVLGPTATWLVRRLVQGLDRYPLGYELDLADTAGALGLSFTPGISNPFVRSLNRCVLFGVAQPFDGGLAVRRSLPPVGSRHLMRMPESLRAMHREWAARPGAATVRDQPRRARLLAAAMVEAGDDPGIVERQLLSLGVPPDVAGAVNV